MLFKDINIEHEFIDNFSDDQIYTDKIYRKCV